MIQSLYRYSQAAERQGTRSATIALLMVAVLLRVRYSIARLRLVLVSKWRKLRVVFVIGDECKWKGQRVYERMLESHDFDPYVMVTAMDLGWIPDEDQPKRVSSCFDFFNKKNVRVLSGMNVENREFVPLAKYKPDIVIYQQPWGMHKSQDVIVASRTALTFYMPYYIPASVNMWQQHNAPLFKLLYASFVEGQQWIDYFRENETRLRIGCRWIPCGCPIREEIADVQNICRERLVIFAPHWSIPDPKVCASGGVSTFLWSGRPILEFAKSHREIKWIFKPHPMLKYKLQESGCWTESEIEEYYSEWGKVGTVCETGDYFRDFHRSMAMITDCLSFLTEYLVVNRPLIRLENPGTMNDKLPGCEKFAAMYRVQNIVEMNNVLDSVILQGSDPLVDKRQEVIGTMGYDKNDISSQMLGLLRKQIGR